LIEGTDKEIKKLEIENSQKINFLTYKTKNTINNKNIDFNNNNIKSGELYKKENDKEIFFQSEINDNKMNIDDLLEYINSNSDPKKKKTKKKNKKKMTSIKKIENISFSNNEIDISSKRQKVKSKIKRELKKEDSSDDDYIYKFKNNLLKSSCHSSYIFKENPKLDNDWIDNISQLI